MTSDLFIPGVPQVNVTPPTPVTNYSHPKCYARALKDCDRKISSEHYVSGQVLELWADNGEIWTNMHVFPHDKLSQLSISRLGPKILCKRHNESLSGLDEIGGDFCRFIRNTVSQPRNVVINGSDLERWFLKLFLGYSIVFYKQERGIKNWQPPIALLNVLFNKQPLEEDCGLYGFSMQKVNRSGSGLSLNYVSDKNTNDGVGILFNIEGLVMFFGITPPPPVPPNPNVQLHYHPTSIVISENFITRELHTGWSNGVRLIYPK